jgi:hypothetical protein
MTHRRVDVIAGHQQAGRDPQHADADAEAHRIDMVHVDADKLGALLLLRDRADRAAQVGVRHEGPKRQRRRHRAAEGHHLGHRHEGAQHVESGKAIGGVDRLGIGGERHQRQVFQNDRQAQRDQQDVLVPAMPGPGDQPALQAVAKREHQRRHDQQRDIGIKPQEPPQEIDGIEPHHQQRPMGEVDDVQDAVDQRQPQRDQRIERARRHPVQDRGPKDRHVRHRRLPHSSGGGAARPRPGPDTGPPGPDQTIGNLTWAWANSAGRITSICPPCTWVFTGWAPVFCPSTILVGP